MPLTEDASLRERLYPYRAEEPRAADYPLSWADEYEKILVERAVMGDPGLPGTVLRFPAVYGPRDGQRRLFPYLERMDDGRPAILLGEGMARWRWSRGYVENVAAAVALAATDERAAGRTYNVGETETPTEAEWVRAIGGAAGWDGGLGRRGRRGPLKRLRALPKGAPEREAVAHPLLLTVSAISSGLLNTG